MMPGSSLRLSLFFSTSDGHAGASEHDWLVYGVTKSYYELHAGKISVLLNFRKNIFTKEARCIAFSTRRLCRVSFAFV